MRYYIKERYNRQLGIYYVPMGKITVQGAKRWEQRTSYGTNYMRKFETEASYLAEIKRLKDSGEKIS